MTNVILSISSGFQDIYPPNEEMGLVNFMHQTFFFFPGKWNMLRAIDLTQEFNKENENVMNSNTFNSKEESPNGNKARASQQSKNKIEG